MPKPSEAGDHGHGHGPNRFGVLPVAFRLGADEGATGRGVTIAFLDSGFVAHPDLTCPENRIVAFHDVESPGARLEGQEPRSMDWHGTQTSVVAAGNGFLSEGLYRGLASEARVALIKVGSGGRIGDQDIAHGLEWVLENRERLGIRVCSISLGGDLDAPLAASRVNQLAEELNERGVVLVVAAGNAGCSEDHHPRPPATAPSAITVGGYDDANELDRRLVGLYCSSFGTSADGIAKPEILAPSIGVAAPILPGTLSYARAQTLSRLAAEPDALLDWRLAEMALEDPDLSSLAGQSASQTRANVERAFLSEKIVATHYQHVEGTSFAAPIVASLVAQMLELSPSLTPEAVKRLLVDTAEPLPGAPAARQGNGILCAGRAVSAARSEVHGADRSAFAAPHAQTESHVFTHHDDGAGSVHFASELNGWEFLACPFVRTPDGIWRFELPAPPPGRYRYKLVIDGARWISDPSHGRKEPDPYGDFDSILDIKDVGRRT
ncbi:MAG TPA: S8 family serine peptidase [Thermoanaerobaculia bacterium]|nr:S8 family serine peptidase [Thermoanaerobaculia bacterium]